jgi:hypothetical protein
MLTFLIQFLFDETTGSIADVDGVGGGGGVG